MMKIPLNCYRKTASLTHSLSIQDNRIRKMAFKLGNQMLFLVSSNPIRNVQFMLMLTDYIVLFELMPFYVALFGKFTIIMLNQNHYVSMYHFQSMFFLHYIHNTFSRFDSLRSHPKSQFWEKLKRHCSSVLFRYYVWMAAKSCKKNHIFFCWA